MVAIEGGLVPCLSGLGDRFPAVIAQIVIGPLVEGDADHRYSEVTAAFESVDGGEELLLGEVTRGAEHDEEVRTGGIGWGLQRHGISLGKPWSSLKLLRVVSGVVEAM